MDNSQIIEKIKLSAKSIADIKVEDYLRLETLGDKFGFKRAESTLLQIKNHCSQILLLDFKDVPRRKAETVASNLTTVGTNLYNIKEFDPEKPKTGDRDTLIQYLDESYYNLFETTLPLFGYSSSTDEKIKQSKDSINQFMLEINNSKTELDKEKKDYKQAANELLENIKETAAESGVTRHSQIFAIEAKGHKLASLLWIVIILLFLICAYFIGEIILNITPDSKIPSLFQIIQYSIIKIIAFSTLYYILVFLFKNYNAQRHNYIINKHRQNSLTTFQTFVNSTTNPEMKDAILLQTTQAIFSFQKSGYLKNESDDTGQNKFIEIIKSANNTINSKT